MGKVLQNIDEKTFQKTKEFLLNSFFSHICKDKLLNNKELNNIHKFCVATKSFDLVSIAMSYLALNNYRQGARYYQTLSLLNDAKYLANSANDLIAQKINLFCLGLVEYYEKNIEISLNLIKASLFIKIIGEHDFDNAILKYKQKIENENQQKMISSTPPSFIPNEIKAVFLELKLS